MKARLILITLIVAFGVRQAKSQTGYTFFYGTNAYTELTGFTYVVNDIGFDGSFHAVPIGFNFHYWGKSYSSINVSTDGYFNFATGAYGFYPFYSSLKSIGNASISYKLDNSGGAGNRILKIQFKNVFFEIDVNNRDSASFQYWLYEGSDKIELRYGNSNIDTADYKILFGNTMGPQVALSNPTLSIFYNLKGNYSSPTMVTNPLTYTFLTGYPTESTTYVFSPKPTAVPVVRKNSLIVYPNPLKDKVIIQVPGAITNNVVNLVIANMSGQIVKNETRAITNSLITTRVDDLPAGNYSISIEYTGTRYTGEITVIK